MTFQNKSKYRIYKEMTQKQTEYCNKEIQAKVNIKMRKTQVVSGVREGFFHRGGCEHKAFELPNQHSGM